MKKFNLSFWGRTRYWWVVLTVGILMVICGFAYWIWPVSGFAIASQLFGWLLVLAGIIDMFIGFMLVRSVVLSEAVFPYFIAIIFLYWGISAIISSVSQRDRRYWWLYLINGILLMIIGFFFIEAGWVQDMMMTSFLTSLAFIYWGFSIAMVSYDMKPTRN